MRLPEGYSLKSTTLATLAREIKTGTYPSREGLCGSPLKSITLAREIKTKNFLISAVISFCFPEKHYSRKRD